MTAENKHKYTSAFYIRLQTELINFISFAYKFWLREKKMMKKKMKAKRRKSGAIDWMVGDDSCDDRSE